MEDRDGRINSPPEPASTARCSSLQFCASVRVGCLNIGRTPKKCDQLRSVSDGRWPVESRVHARYTRSLRHPQARIRELLSVRPSIRDRPYVANRPPRHQRTSSRHPRATYPGARTPETPTVSQPARVCHTRRCNARLASLPHHRPRASHRRRWRRRCGGGSTTTAWRAIAWCAHDSGATRARRGRAWRSRRHRRRYGLRCRRRRRGSSRRRRP